MEAPEETSGGKGVNHNVKMAGESLRSNHLTLLLLVLWLSLVVSMSLGMALIPSDTLSGRSDNPTNHNLSFNDLYAEMSNRYFFQDH